MTTKLRLYQLIADQMDRSVADLTDDTLLRGNELGMDSLDCVELVMSAEDDFDLIIPDEDVESLLTIGQASEYIERRIAEQVGKSTD